MSEHTVCDITPLEHGALHRVCTQEELANAANTHGASVLDDMFIGVDQERFSQALAFGLDEASKSHIFVAGISGLQALNAVKTFIIDMLASRVPSASDLPDLCCLYNFANPLQPITITLPKGKGNALQQRMQSLLTQLQERIPIAMVRDENVEKRHKINTEFWSWWEVKRLEITQEARKQGILVVFQENQALVNPFSRKQKKAKMDYETSASGDNEEISTSFMGTEERNALPPEERHALQTAKNEWMQKVTMTFVEHTRRLREAGEKIVALNQKIVSRPLAKALA